MKLAKVGMIMLVSIASISSCTKNSSESIGTLSENNEMMKNKQSLNRLNGQDPSSALEQENQKLSGSQVQWPNVKPLFKDSEATEKRVSALLSTMTLEQKVAQMIQPEIRDITVEDMRRYGFGSYLNGGGAFPNDNKYSSVNDWVHLAESMYQASIDPSIDGSTIPTLWGTDAVHGHNNVIGATLYPHNIGLGATHNPDLIKRINQATAKDVLTTGIDWVFAPTVAVAKDFRWGRTYESYSEHPQLVAAFAKAAIEGLQGSTDQTFLNNDHVIGTLKHFVGDGGTVNGDDQGDNVNDEQTLFEQHAQGYLSGIAAGAQTVMASFNSWQGEKLHGHHYLLTEVLKNKLGFDGVVVGDWNGHGQVKGCTNESCWQSINAGVDIFMVPGQSWKNLYKNTIAQVREGLIKEERIDDAVSRILRVKVRYGLFDKPSPAKRAVTHLLSNKNIDENQLQGNHRSLAREAVRSSLVLLKNSKSILPLDRSMNVLVAGDGAHNIGKQSGGWSLSWQGTGNKNEDFPGSLSIFESIKKVVLEAEGTASLFNEALFNPAIPLKTKKSIDVAIVVFGENPYAEGHGDLDNLEFERNNKSNLALLNSFKEFNIPTISVFLTGRPLWVNPEINASDAFVVAWLPGTESEGITDVLFKQKNGEVNYDFTGRLPFRWPNSPIFAKSTKQGEVVDTLFPVGYWLNYGSEPPEFVALDEQAATKYTTESFERNIFERRIFEPWQLIVSDNNESKVGTTSVVSLGSLYVRTVNRIVQEDAYSIKWHGNGEGRFTFRTMFSEDLRAFNTEDGVLSFDLMLSEKDAHRVFVEILCEPTCISSVSLGSEYLSGVVNEWQTVEIPIKCFQAPSMDFSKITSPFQLRSDVATNIRVSNIKWSVSKKKESHLEC